MTRYSKYIIGFLLIATCIFIHVPNAVAQSIDEDDMVLYMKANVLYESGRYDESIRMYNRILNNDESFVKAYMMRAKAKYELSAYKGTKKDIMIFIDLAGVNKEVIKLMASTEYRLNNIMAANNYVKSAIEMDPFDGDLYYLAGMIARDDGRKNDACESFAVGSSLSHSKATIMFNKECYGYIIKSNGRGDSNKNSDNGEVASAVDSTLDKIEEREIPNIEIVKDDKVDLAASQMIKIDDKLDIVITNGLGERKLEEKPSIFILSSEDGHVAIDICIDGDGKVVSAEFNRTRSSINRSSLTSLAIRKAKEFVFMPSFKNESCGTMIYQIKA